MLLGLCAVVVVCWLFKFISFNVLWFLIGW